MVADRLAGVWTPTRHCMTVETTRNYRGCSAAGPIGAGRAMLGGRRGGSARDVRCGEGGAPGAARWAGAPGEHRDLRPWKCTRTPAQTAGAGSLTAAGLAVLGRGRRCFLRRAQDFAARSRRTGQR